MKKIEPLNFWPYLSEKKEKSIKITPTINAPYEQYKGEELRDFTGRKGAMDAFQLPSNFMGKLVYRDGRKKNLPI